MNAVAKQEGAIAPVSKGPSLLARLAGQYDMDPTNFANAIKQTCIKGKATNEQFAAFLMVADRYGLNPLTKEVYAFPERGGGITPIVGVDGWARIINDHAKFDGMDFEDGFDGNGNIHSITCVMWRKDRSRPVRVTEYLAECARGTEPWKKWPARMLRHKAMIQAARLAFGYTGIVEPDEFERKQEAESPTARSPIDQRLASAEPMQLSYQDEDTSPDDAPVGDTSEVSGETAEAGEQSPAEADEQHEGPTMAEALVSISAAQNADQANAAFDQLEASQAWADADEETREKARAVLQAKLMGDEE